MTRGEKLTYIARHGLSADNGNPVYQREEAPLHQTGFEQAEVLAQRVANLPVKPEVLIVSSLLRTRQTAEPIAKVTGLEPIYSDLFVERIKPTSINGKPFTDELATATYHQWLESLYTPGMQVEDGENYDDHVARVDSALAFLEQRPESTMMVVGHGVFTRSILARILLGPALSPPTLKHFHRATETQNTGITKIDYYAGRDPNWMMLGYNDHGHLEQ